MKGEVDSSPDENFQSDISKMKLSVYSWRFSVIGVPLKKCSVLLYLFKYNEGNPKIYVRPPDHY